MSVTNTAQADPLPSLNHGAAKRNVQAFVRAVTHPKSPDFVPPSARIAVFDNDGTLWCEHPSYVQFAFGVDRVKALAPEHPEWRTTQPFQAGPENDPKGIGAAGLKGVVDLMVSTHQGMTSEEFDRIARDWFASARHPRFNRPYTDLGYLPMVEVLGYLRANGFKTYIVSGGGIEFIRVIAEPMYGIPPEQVIGSSGKLKFELRDGVPAIFRLPELEFFDDKGTSRSPSRSSSAGGRSPRSATPTATCRCCSGPPPVLAGGSCCWSITPTPHANSSIACRRWDASTSRRRKPNSAVGRSSA